MSSNGASRVRRVDTIDPPRAVEFWRAVVTEEDSTAIALVRAGQPRVNDIVTRKQICPSGKEETFLLTPLQFAVQQENRAVARALIEQGTDLDLYVPLLQNNSCSKTAPKSPLTSRRPRLPPPEQR